VPIEGREQHLRKYFIYKEIIIMLKGKNKSLVKIAIESAFYTRRNISMCPGAEPHWGIRGQLPP
jgi:hypothetical protein